MLRRHGISVFSEPNSMEANPTMAVIREVFPSVINYPGSPALHQLGDNNATNCHGIADRSAWIDRLFEVCLRTDYRQFVWAKCVQR